MLRPEITNDLARKQWRYIVSEVGIGAALAALVELEKMNRRLFPLNVAKLLKLPLPQLLLTKAKDNRKTKEVTMQEMLKDRSWAYFE